MVIWNGWGFLVGVITFGSLLATEFRVEAAFADDRYYQDHRWPIAAGFGLAAVLTGFVAKLIRLPRSEFFSIRRPAKRSSSTSETRFSSSP